MSTNKQSDSVVTEVELNSRLKAESEMLGKALADMQNDQRSVEQKIEADKAILKELEILRDGLSVEITRLTGRIEKLRADLDTFGPKLQELRDIEKKVNHLGVQLDQMKKEEEVLKNQILVLTETINRRQAELDEVTHAILAKKTELVNVADEVDRAKKIKRDEILVEEAKLEETKAKINGEMAVIQNLQVKKEELHNEVNNLSVEVDKLKTEVGPLRIQAEQSRQEVEKNKVAIEKESEIKKLEWERADGELSIKAASLESKEKKLKEIKVNLEKALGKPININF